MLATLTTPWLGLMFWAVLGLCLLYVFRRGGQAERDAALLVLMASSVTLGTNLYFGVPFVYAPLLYGLADAGAILWLLRYQSANWLWMIAGLFTLMLASTAYFVLASGIDTIAYSHYWWKTTLVGLAYAQLAITGFMTFERQHYERDRVGTAFQGVVGAWSYRVISFLLSNSWRSPWWVGNPDNEKPVL